MNTSIHKLAPERNFLSLSRNLVISPIACQKQNLPDIFCSSARIFGTPSDLQYFAKIIKSFRPSRPNEGLGWCLRRGPSISNSFGSFYVRKNFLREKLQLFGGLRPPAVGALSTPCCCFVVKHVVFRCARICFSGKHNKLH